MKEILYGREVLLTSDPLKFDVQSIEGILSLFALSFSLSLRKLSNLAYYGAVAAIWHSTQGHYNIAPSGWQGVSG